MNASYSGPVKPVSTNREYRARSAPSVLHGGGVDPTVFRRFTAPSTVISLAWLATDSQCVSERMLRRSHGCLSSAIRLDQSVLCCLTHLFVVESKQDPGVGQ